MEELKEYLSVEDKSKLFLEAIENIKLEKTHQKQIDKINRLLRTNIIYGNGYFSSWDLEEILLNISKTINVDISNKYEKNSFLHIMTRTYETGGHTRVVERWIDSSPSGEKHSLLLTEQEINDIPKRLNGAVVSKNGNLISLLDIKDFCEKAKTMRKIASNYEIIILHVHMHDITPVLAFGVEEFKRPIIFYNHADHLFWIGGSIADVVAELREWGQDISRKYRGIDRNHIISVPSDINKCNVEYDKNSIKTELGLPLDKKIVLTMASANKYIPFDNIDFLKVAKDILENTDVVIIAIGIDFNILLNWKDFAEIYNDRFIIKPLIPYKDIQKYIMVSDLYIDSMPIGGGTSVIDIIRHNVPVLSLKTPISQFDYLVKSDCYCLDMKDFMMKFNLYLHNTKESHVALEQVKLNLKLFNAIDNWQKNVHCLYDKIKDGTHKIYIVNSEKCQEEAVNNQINKSYQYFYTQTVKKYFFGLIKKIKREDYLYKYRIVCVFGVKFIFKYIKI